jgi:hypothetical protein
MADDPRGLPTYNFRDGKTWRIGTQEDVAWIDDDTPGGPVITSAIPAVFESYATIVIPEDDRHEHDAAILRILTAHTSDQPWWLGFLDTSGADDVVFVGAPMVSIYAHWKYVLVEAGPEQAATWRASTHSWRGDLPDVMFPTDRSWLISRLWDDDWWCLGGPAAIVDSFAQEPDLQTQRVNTDEDATPPGHTAR